MSRIAELLVKIAADPSQFSTAMKAVSYELGKVARESDSAMAGFRRAAQTLSDTGTRLTVGISAPLAGVAVASLRAASDFEVATNRIEALLSGTTADMKRLEDTAIDLGKATMFSSRQAAEGMAELAAKGFDTQKILTSMPAVLDLAAAGTLGIAEASQIATDVMNAFGMKATEVRHIADVLAKAANSSSANVGDLGITMSYVAGPAKAAGLSLEETAAAASILGDAGLRGERGGTALRGILAALADPSRESAALMERLGIQVQDASGKFRPLADIVDQLREKQITLGQASQLVGREASTALLNLVTAGGDSLRKLTADFEKGDDAVKKMAATMTKGLPGAAERAKGSIEAAGVSVGKLFEPAAMRAAGTVEKLANTLADLAKDLRSLPVETQAAGLAIYGIGIAAGPAITALGQLGLAGIGLTSGFRLVGAAFAGATGALAALIPAAYSASAATAFLAAGISVTAVLAGAAAVYKLTDAIVKLLDARSELAQADQQGQAATQRLVTYLREQGVAGIRELESAYQHGKITYQQFYAEITRLARERGDAVTAAQQKEYDSVSALAYQLQRAGVSIAGIQERFRSGVIVTYAQFAEEVQALAKAHGFLGSSAPAAAAGVANAGQAAAATVAGWKSLSETLSEVEGRMQSVGRGGIAEQEWFRTLDLARSAKLPALELPPIMVPEITGIEAPASLGPAARAFEDLAAEGLATREALAALLDLLNLVPAGADRVGQAFRIASAVMTGFGLAATESVRVADVLAAAASRTAVNAGDLGQALAAAAEPARRAGLSLENTAAAAVALAEGGLVGEEAGRALGRLLDALSSPTAEAAQRMEQLGIRTRDSAGQMLPLTSILEQIRAAEGRLGDVTQLVSSQAMPGLTAALRVGGDRLRDLTGQFGQVSGAARQMGESITRDTALAELAARGMDAQQAMAALPGVLDLSAIASLGLKDATSIATEVLRAFALEADASARVADVLARASGPSAAGIADLGRVLAAAAEPARRAGWTLEETAAAAAILAEAGLTGSRGAAVLRSMLESIIAPSAEASRQMAELGIQVRDSAGKLLPLADIIRQVSAAHGGMAQATSIVSRDALPALLAMLSAGSTGLAELAERLQQSDGAARELADRIRELLAIPIRITLDNVGLVQEAARAKDALGELGRQTEVFESQSTATMRGASAACHEMGREFERSFRQASRDIGQLIWQGGKVGDVLAESGRRIGQAWTQAAIDQILGRVASKLLDLGRAVPGVSKALSVLFGSGEGGGAAGVVGAAKKATEAASAVPQAGGGVTSGISGAAGSGISGVVNLITSAVSAVTGIIGAFQMAGMTKDIGEQGRTLIKIEQLTRDSLLTLREFLPATKDVWSYLWNVQLPLLTQMTDAMVWGRTPAGSLTGGSTQPVFNITGQFFGWAGMDEFIDEIVKRLKLRGA